MEQLKIKIIELCDEIGNDTNSPITQLHKIVYNRKNEEMLLKLPILRFLQSIHLSRMTPQKYGFLVQARIKKDLGYSKAKNKDSGDAYKDDKNIEIKCSLITNTNKSFNLRQARQWQECDYNILVVDIKIWNKPIIYFFKLTHSDMEQELILCDAGKSHSRGEEMSITINVDEMDKNFERWLQKYRTLSPWDDELNKNLS